MNIHFDPSIIEGMDIDAALYEIDKINAEDSLAEFVSQAWHVIEPGQPYVHGWHIDMICEHLEAITFKETIDGSPYNRLLINVPPGMMKSLLVNVFWPAWEWGPRNMPHLRYVCAAHKVENLSARDSRRMRQIITSEWYQKRWGDRVSLAKDQNEKLNFVNSATGFRIATAITSLTGIRGDRVIIDDPHSVDSAGSDAKRAAEVETFLEAIPTRLNSPEESAIVVIMQRLHEKDISGVIIDKKLGYDHLMLPMRFDPGRAYPTKLGWNDPREDEGELLFPQRFPESVVDRDENTMGPYATASQHQQSPEPRGGGIIKREWWQLWDHPSYPPMDYVIASLDTAYTTKTSNDPSALTVWGVFSGNTIATPTKQILRDGSIEDMGVSRETRRFADEQHPKVMLMFGWSERLELHDLVQKVEQTCRDMRVDKLIIENKAAGISVAQEIRRLYSDAEFSVQLVDTGANDKIARLYSVQHLFAEGLIYSPDKSWSEIVINQCSSFPKAAHDDLVDTTSQAIKFLRSTGMLRRYDEVRSGIEQEMHHRGLPPPSLYPV